MTAHKLLIVATLALIAGLIVGSTLFADSLVMSMAGTDTFSFVLRGGISILLIALLVTNPPRSYALRTALGAWSLMLITVSFQMLMNYQLHLLDAVVFFEVAIIFGLEALETRTSIPVRQKGNRAYKVPVLSA